VRKLLLPALWFALVGALASPAWADAPTRASGTFTAHSDVLQPFRTADGNTAYHAVDTVTFSGAISGTATDTYTLTVHRTGLITGQGTETCAACTVGGRTGGYTAVFSFSGTLAQFAGHLTVVEATGGLTGLRGEGTFQGDATGPGTFAGTTSISSHFEP
jgi:hypothetical protein